MKKEDKGLIIGQLTEIVKEYPNFYLTDIEALDAEKTSKLRRECFKKEIKLVVVKNNLLKKALENVEGDFSPLQVAMKGNTAVMFSQTANAPARLIKEFTKDAKKDAPVKPELKAAYVQESFYIGAENLECGKIDVGRQPVVPAPDNILHTCRVRVRRVGRYVLGVCDLHPLRSRTDLKPLAAARRTGRGVCGAHL